jgi:hypothetical protein
MVNKRKSFFIDSLLELGVEIGKTGFAAGLLKIRWNT